MWIKISLAILVILLIALFVLVHVIAKKLVQIALIRENTWYQGIGHRQMNQDAFTKAEALTEEEHLEKRLGDSFWESGKKISVKSRDGLTLVGKAFNENPNRWVIAVHGYRATGKRDMAYVASRYAKEGYSVLVPDLRAHGESEGHYIGMGWLDRLDLLQWIAWITEKFPNSKIILHGGSMGASTILMASGERLPENVELLIADSGYASVYQEFRHVLQENLRLPQRFLLPSANRIAKKMAGYSLIQASAVKQLGSNHLPLLVIHGEADKFVPIEAAGEIIRASAGPSQFLAIPEASHLTGMTVEPTKYWQTIFTFIKNYQK